MRKYIFKIGSWHTLIAAALLLISVLSYANTDSTKYAYDPSVLKKSIQNNGKNGCKKDLQTEIKKRKMIKECKTS